MSQSKNAIICKLYLLTDIPHLLYEILYQNIVLALVASIHILFFWHAPREKRNEKLLPLCCCRCCDVAAVVSGQWPVASWQWPAYLLDTRRLQTQQNTSPDH